MFLGVEVMQMEKHLLIYKDRIRKIFDKRDEYIKTAKGKEKELLQHLFYVLQVRNVSPLQIDKYLRVLHMIYQTTTLSQLDKVKVKGIVLNMLNKPNWSNATKSSLLATFKSLLNIISQQTKIDYGIEDLKVNRKLKAITEMDIPTISEIQSLITFARTLEMKTIIAILSNTGLRIGELLSIQYGNVKVMDDGIYLDVTGKTGQRRVILANDSVAYQLFRTYLQRKGNLNPSDFVFGNGKPFYHNFNQKFKRLVDELKEQGLIRKSLKLTFHTLRHFAVTNAVNHGIPEMYLKKIFGWSKTTKMVARYTKLNDQLAINFMKKISI